MKVHKTLIACCITAGTLFSEAKAQFPHGPYLGLDLKSASPLNESFSRIFKTGVGGTLKMGFQVGDNCFITSSADYFKHGVKKEKIASGMFKDKNILTLQGGVRYHFKKQEEATSAFFMEPQLGWTLVGKNYNTISITPVVGYTFNGKLDLLVWYRTTTSKVVSSDLSMAGIGLAYNIFLSNTTE